MARVFIWTLNILLGLALVLMIASAALAQPPFSKGDTGFVSGSFCNRKGHEKVMEALLSDFKTGGKSFAQVWEKQTKKRNCNTISETLVLTIDKIKYEGVTSFGETWTIKYLVAGIVEIFSGWFERGPQPEPMKFEEQSI